VRAVPTRVSLFLPLPAWGQPAAFVPAVPVVEATACCYRG
jgi:hypothetical protein